MRDIDVDNSVIISTTEITTNSSGVVVGEFGNANGVNFTINDISYSRAGGTERYVWIEGVPANTRLKLSASNTTSHYLRFVPYKSN